MVWAAPAALALCLRFSADLVKAAAVTLIIGAVLSATEQHPDLSASVLQGFQCIPASDLPAADILIFAHGLQNGTAELSAAQLSCLARLLTAKNLTADFSRYPPDLLLFFNSAEVRGGTCQEFYTQASHGNLDLLPRGSSRRMGLLRGALTCLGVRSSHLYPEQLSSLGALVCDMEPETITASDPSIVENLKLCSALTGAQQDALNAVLLGGGTVYGDPSGWDLQTLQNLGPLVLALNQTTLSLVAEAVREDFIRSIAAMYSSQGHSQREKSLTFLRTCAAVSASSHPRLKRSVNNCPSTPITASTIPNSILIIDYSTSEEFDLCLSNEVLKANLKPLLDQPLTKELLYVMKKKLKQIYPLGIPEDQLKLLGQLSRQYTAEEISQWPVISNSTLSALLNPSDGKWKAPQVQQLLRRYQAGGGTLTGPLLQKMGGRNLCKLQEKQIENIPPEAIKIAGQLDISSCSQTKKDQLYRKAQEAFADQAGTTRAYYCQIWPYLGGAPAKDLKDLAKAGVAIDMDIDTFLALNPDELQKLSVMDVKNLLGENLHYLKEAENETLVKLWVKRQSQRELDCALGIGLQGGTEEPSPTTTPPHSNASATITPTATTVSVPTTSPTVPTPIDISSLPSTSSSTIPDKAPTSSAISPNPPHSTPPHTYTTALSSAGSPPATSTTQPTPTTDSIVPCSIHQSATSNKATTPAVTLLTTILATANPNTTSPSSVPSPALTHGAATTTSVATANPNTTSPSSIPPPALTHGATTTTSIATANPNTTSPSSIPPPALTHGAAATTTTSIVTNPAITTHNTSTLLVSTTPPAPGGSVNPAPATHNTTTPSTHSAPSTLIHNSTSATAATAATEMNLPSHKPSPAPNSTVSTQENVVSSTAKTTTLACKTSAPPAFLGPSSTTSSSETTKNPPAGVPEPPRPTPGGYINLQPEAGSGSRLSSCLLPILTTASLLRGFL